MDKTRQSYIYAGLAIIFWSTVPTAFKICLKEIAILPLLSIASFSSTFVILILIISGKKFELIRKSTGKELLSSALLGFINPFIYYLILLKAYSLLPAQIAQPLNMIWPIILVFLSVLILHQKIERKNFLALIVSFAGVFIISSQGKLFEYQYTDLAGIVLATGSSLFFALYFILNMKDRREEAVKLFLNFLFGTIYFIIAAICSDSYKIDFRITGILASVYIGFFEMGITFFFWLKALQMASTTARVSNLVYIAPFISLLFVHFFLHEPVYYTTPAGLLLITTGILIQTRKPART
jgi:drug/metabolite transporter (DMT)-like permease